MVEPNNFKMENIFFFKSPRKVEAQYSLEVLVPEVMFTLEEYGI